ncbi:non-ribosomal peptide synthetase [Streptomyces sp. rh34]|uniref:non-ribosomal peptide synthetase n=1 Tax=Streptomyces sp. rh34 TaxID=2034272 RepID=UPI001C54FB94|nr:non-ribosomal peptide synthetase [Streptomyces sp. rh34]
MPEQVQGLRPSPQDGEPPHDLIEQFHRTVRNLPERTAVQAGDGALTFAELDHRSVVLAAELERRGVGPGDRVGVGLPRGHGLVVALLAVWRIGAAYVPLDPEYPAARLGFMVREAAVRVLLAGRGSAVDGIGVDVLDPAGAGSPAHPHAGRAGGPHSPAYVIFTSGSTGQPKGVEITRGAVASLYAALEESGAFGPPTVVAWNASVSFDASVAQWARICRGDTLVVLGEDDRKAPDRLADLLDRFAVTDLDLTPSHWELLREHLLAPRPDGRRMRLFMGGEPVPARTWRELADARERGGPEALNLYGPTECTVEATLARFAGPEPHLGDALPGSRLHLLDTRLREVPPGSVGELYIGGPRLATGYVNRPGLTAERFVADPFGPPGDRLYRTGDRARRTGEGTLEFHGRADRQVKMRGFRVELGDVEAALLGCAEVSAAAVVRDEGPAGERLLAYCTVRPDTGAGTDSDDSFEERLRAHAARVLPDHLLPSAVLLLPSLPLTPNGKLDEAALPKPEQLPAPVPQSSPRPLSGTEDLIAAVWSEVLVRDGIGADSDFFALGGHSLLALRVVGRLKRSEGVVIATKDVYRHPRLRELAAYVDSLRTASEASR